jgi:glutathione synthase/RimK-type ligase-like ATP-grasp enzyme
VKELYILTAYDDFIGQTRKPWVSIDTKLFIEELQKLGFKVHKHEFHEVMNGKVKPEHSLIFYSFSHRDNLRHYIRDCLMYLKSQGNTLIPSFELFCCHENKGWQELLKNGLGIHSLQYHYFSSKREMAGYDLKFPLVFKTLTGSNSTGVALVNSRQDILKELARHEAPVSWTQKLDFWRRKHLRKSKKFPGYPNYDLVKDAQWYQDYMTPEIPFVLQKFIPGLSYDYRVIVLGDKYFVSKRHTKAGDFRASGAKLFDFDLKNPGPLLDKADELYTCFKTPFLSIDLGEDASGKLYLFEYQASHFGINAIVRGKGYFQKDAGNWQFHQSKPQFELFLAQGLAHFLKA